MYSSEETAYDQEKLSDVWSFACSWAFANTWCRVPLCYFLFL